MFQALFKIEFLRSKEATFWFIIFPILLTILLTSIFGDIEKNAKFRIGYIGENRFVKNLEDYFEVLKIEKVEEIVGKNLDAVVVFEDNFDTKLQRALFLSKTKLFKPVNVEIFYTDKEYSKVVKDILVNIFSSLNALNSDKEVKLKVIKREKSISYSQFLYASILVMNIMSVTFFGFSSQISFYKRQGLLRRINCTPYSLGKFYFVYALVSLLQIVFANIIFTLFDFFVYGVKADFLNISIYTLFGSVVFLSLGYMMASLIENPETIVVLGNILFQVFMFAGGFYFDVKNAGIIGILSKIIPSTYLVDGIRKSFGYYAYKNHFLIPLIWVVFSISFVALSNIIKRKKASSNI
ncbi:ABC-2 type transport system permease protein [Thermosipho japonicus]|uniref:ABC-2 type transport system permease protein n=1 Tax=Thermosipho japonicus TaxID=90323 RepID=A0A841GK60_9BACT|nr:ABC transporter permease [Thermosipho japonicus]MBB6062395.1 ABC-2 type transport system permease protein [Thermosipho japonicus]